MNSDEEDGDLFEFSDEDNGNLSDGVISDINCSSDESEDESERFVSFIHDCNKILLYSYIYLVIQWKTTWEKMEFTGHRYRHPVENQMVSLMHLT